MKLHAVKHKIQSPLRFSKVFLGVSLLVLFASVSVVFMARSYAASDPTSLSIANTTLRAGSHLVSPDGNMKLEMQSDGNLVLYNQQNVAVWYTATGNSGANRLEFQAGTDGNLVLYTAGNIPVWNAATSNQSAKTLTVQNDGNLVLYNTSNVAIWSSATNGMQTSTGGCKPTVPTSLPQSCTSTVANFNAANQPSDNVVAKQVTKFDTDGNAIDTHDSDLEFFNGKYYLYGPAQDCGYEWAVSASQFCGFKSYSSTDLNHWQYEGYLYDGWDSQPWQNACTNGRLGCFRSHIIYNDSTKQYVLWINTTDNLSSYHVFTSSRPNGGFVERTAPTLARMSHAPSGYSNGDFDLFKDDDGKAYIVYSSDVDPASFPNSTSHVLRVQALDSTYTTGSGSAVLVGSMASGNHDVEAPTMFKKGSTYYVLYGPGCGYCGGTPSLYRTAQTILGNWSDATSISQTSCGGQPSFVNKFPTSSGGTVYVYGSDLWNPPVKTPAEPVRNQGLANMYWEPLSFSATGAIQPLKCGISSDIPLAGGLTGYTVTPRNFDQTSAQSGFSNWADKAAGWQRAQSFTIGRNGTLSKISVTVFQQDIVPDTAQNRPNAPLGFSIYAAASNGTPQGPRLYYGEVAPTPSTGISFSPKNVNIFPNFAVTAGAKYVLVLSSQANVNGGAYYGWMHNDANPYPAGVESYWNPSTGTWNPEPSRDLKFQTVVQ